jgi:hypothetical protein
VSIVELPESVLRDLVSEFGADAGRVAEHALRSEITRHRITRAIRSGEDPASAVAVALSNDPSFVAGIDALAQGGPMVQGSLEERLRRWAV